VHVLVMWEISVKKIKVFYTFVIGAGSKRSVSTGEAFSTR